MAGAVTLSESNNETRIEWKINHFFKREDNLIISPYFTLFKSKCILQIHLGSKFVLPLPQPDNVFREPLRMSLLTPNSLTEHHIEYRMGILRSDGSEIRTEKLESVLRTGLGQTPQRRELISRKDFERSINTLVPENILTVFCAVSLLNSVKPIEKTQSPFRSFFSNSPPDLIFCDEKNMAGEITFGESKNGIRIEWKINDLFNRGYSTIESPYFIIFKSKWYLKISQQTNYTQPFPQQGNVSRLSLRMWLYRAYCTLEHHIEYRMGIQKPDGSEITTEKSEILLRSAFYTPAAHELISENHSESFRDALIPANTLQVFCIVRLLNNVDPDGVAPLPSIYGDIYQFNDNFRNAMGNITLGESKNETRIEWRINNFFILEDNSMRSPNFTLFTSNWYLQIYHIAKNYGTFSKGCQDSKKSMCMILQREDSTVEHHIEYRMGIQKPDGSEIRTEKFESVFQPRFRKHPQERELVSGKNTESYRNTLGHGNNLIVFCLVRLLNDVNMPKIVPSTIPLTTGLLQQTNQVTPLNDAPFKFSLSLNNPITVKSFDGKDPHQPTNQVTPFKFGEPRAIKHYFKKNPREPSNQVIPFNFGGFPFVLIPNKTLPIKTYDGKDPESSKDVCLCKGNHTLSGKFESLYRSQRFTDVTIRVQSKEFHAHKLILSTRSEVFASMFEHDTAEKRSGVLDIIDCDPDSFEDFLLYLYSGKLDVVSSSNAVSLFKTADKYGLDELKDECTKCMSKKMTVDSFCEIFHLAALHDESDLLSTATNFFIRNANAILITKEWLTLLQDQASLCNELLVKFAKSGLQK